MFLSPYISINTIKTWVIYFIIILIILLILCLLNKYILKENREVYKNEIYIYSNLKEIIFLNKNYKKYRNIELRENSPSGLIDIDY